MFTLPVHNVTSTYFDSLANTHGIQNSDICLEDWCFLLSEMIEERKILDRIKKKYNVEKSKMNIRFKRETSTKGEK
jgi:hypothetical protein